MQFVRREDDALIIQNLFNSEHAEQLISKLAPTFKIIVFKNVGIKIMRLILNHFEQTQIRQINIEYNWNSIMANPKLICYDKSQWKTLQQLNNWNRQWSELFLSSFYLEALSLTIECSWMDDQFAQIFLEGVSRVPNIKWVSANFASKNKSVEQILSAIQKAKIFRQYEYRFKQLK